MHKTSWLVEHSIPRNEIDSKLTKYLIDLGKQKSSGSREEEYNLNHETDSQSPQSVPRLDQFTNSDPFEEGLQYSPAITLLFFLFSGTSDITSFKPD